MNWEIKGGRCDRCGERFLYRGETEPIHCRTCRHEEEHGHQEGIDAW